MSEVQHLHEPFAKFLRDRKIPFVRARSDRESTIAIGHPDFTIIVNGCCLLIEFKEKDGKLSPEQIARIAELAASGTKVHVIRSLDSALELFGAWVSTLKDVRIPDHRPKLVRFGNVTYEDHGGILKRVKSDA